ncbi:FAD-binding protein [Chloroflexota bacterium]
MKKEIVEADVLCIGGGIAGLMAAIRASELGAKVVVAEKGNTLRSGAGACGNDHFQCYLPEFHGTDFEAFMEEIFYDQMASIARMKDKAFLRAWLLTSSDIVKLWDRWGIPMKYKGKWEFAGHHYPGLVPRHLKYAGEDQKSVLTREALGKGVQIINRVMMYELINDGNIIGALGVDTREDRIIGFRAKSVILGTGGCIRLYPGTTPGWMSNLTHPFNMTGDGRAMAYRSGAELVNVELPLRHSGPKYFSRCGQATWVGVLRDPQGRPLGPFLEKPDIKYSDMTTEMNKRIFEDYMRSGRGPVYMDCGGLSDDDFEYMKYWLRHEGNTGLLNHMAEENIDPRKNPVEFMTYETRIRGGVHTNEMAQTSIGGLYAAGDETFYEISGAAVFGWIAGENAAKYAREAGFADTSKVNTKMEEMEDFIDEIRSREAGPDWKEVNIALQQLMSDYAGSVRSETLLTAGHKYIQRLREKTQKSIIAKNQHELIHCLEVLDLLELGELVFVTADTRKETRGLHVRIDYSYTNPPLDQLLLVKKVNEQPAMEWREVKR